MRNYFAFSFFVQHYSAGCAQSEERAGAVHHGAEHGLDRHHPRGGGGPRVRDALTQLQPRQLL